MAAQQKMAKPRTIASRVHSSSGVARPTYACGGARANDLVTVGGGL